MEFFHWVEKNLFDILQTIAIGGAFVTIVRERKSRKVQNRLYFTQRHAQLWRRYVVDPKLGRVKKADIDLTASPVTEYEESFVREVLNNFAATYYASENGVFTQPEALPDDIRSFFSLPIPKAVWERSKKFHDSDFVDFVESHFHSQV